MTRIQSTSDIWWSNLLGTEFLTRDLMVFQKFERGRNKGISYNEGSKL